MRALAGLWLALGIAASAAAVASAGAPGPARAGAPDQKTCAATPRHLAAPDTVALGGRVTITLSLTADCSSVHVPAHVALAFDNSAAMGGVRMNYMKQAVTAFAGELDYSVARLGLTRYNQTAEILAPLTDDPNQVIEAAQQFYPRPGSNITMGVRAARQMLEQGRAIAAVPDPEEVIILLVGDQNDNGPEEALAEADLAKAAGMTIITIGAGVNADPVLLEGMATSPALYRSEGTGSRWPSLYTSLAGELGTVSAVGAAITTTLPTALEYQFGTGFPVPRIRGQQLTWQFGVFPPEGLSLQFQVKANELGRHPVSTGATGDLIMDRGPRQPVAFTIPEVDVVSDVPVTPGDATPIPTASPTPGFRRVFLPMASQGDCIAPAPPSETVVVIDTSRTMMTAFGHGVRLDAAVEAGALILDALHFPSETGSVIAVADEAVLLEPPTASRGALIYALGATYSHIGSDSNLEKGLALAASLPPAPGRRRVIVALTDGVNDVASASSAVRAARATGAGVQVVGFGPSTNAAEMRAVAGAGGHWSPDRGELGKAIDRARSELRCGR